MVKYQNKETGVHYVQVYFCRFDNEGWHYLYDLLSKNYIWEATWTIEREYEEV